jgi:2'-5' RNA ligase
MKYFIAYLLTGEAAKKHDSLTGEIADKFGVFRLTGFIPPHVTLKRPFDSENLAEVEGALSGFSESNVKQVLKFRGFGTFGRDVIFADVYFSPGTRKLVGELDEALKKIPWLNFDEFETDRKFHATLAHKDVVAEKFNAICSYLSTKHFEFDELLDNISILKKDGETWTVHKQYFLK